MASFNFSMNCNRPDKYNRCVIWLRYYHKKSNPVFFDTAQRVQEKYWNKKKMRVRPAHPSADQINELLDFYDTEMQGLINRCKMNRNGSGAPEAIEPSKEYIKREFNRIIKPNQSKELLIHDCYEDFLKEIEIKVEKGELSPRTLSGHKNTMTHFFNVISKAATMREVNLESYNSLLDYFSIEKMNDNTAGKEIKNLRAFFNWLNAQKILEVSDYADFKKIRGKRKLVYLNKSEFKIYKDYSPTGDFPVLSHDISTLSGLTGLRKSDLLNLDWSEVHQRNNEYYIVKPQGKTDMPVSCLLLKGAVEIMEKYRGGNTKVFPRVSDDRELNEQIRKIGKACGIDQPFTQNHFIKRVNHPYTKPKYDFLSLKAFRSTFSMIMDEAGASMKLRSKLLGHTSIKTTEQYYDSFDISQYTEIIKEAFAD